MSILDDECDFCGTFIDPIGGDNAKVIYFKNSAKLWCGGCDSTRIPVLGKAPPSNTGINPKDKIGVKKAPLRLVPPSLMIAVSDAMADGAKKYGPFNWRESNVKASVYAEAILRHLFAYLDGEDKAEDSGHSHIAHIAACAAILIDAEENNCLTDDRPLVGPAPKMLKARDKTGTVLPPSKYETDTIKR